VVQLLLADLLDQLHQRTPLRQMVQLVLMGQMVLWVQMDQDVRQDMHQHLLPDNLNLLEYLEYLNIVDI
jgi:hypothetical protein